MPLRPETSVNYTAGMVFDTGQVSHRIGIGITSNFTLEGPRDRHHDRQFERELIRERTVAGLKATRARGRKGGRTFALSKARVRLPQAALAHRDASGVRAVPGARHQAGDARDPYSAARPSWSGSMRFGPRSTVSRGRCRAPRAGRLRRRPGC